MNRDATIESLYKEGLSGVEISEREGINITPRQIQRVIKALGITRSPSERFINAIKRGRRTYTRKPPEQLIRRKQLGVKMRYFILEKYAFRCCSCGNTARDARIEIDHKDNNPSNNIESNLWLLCDVCNKGKYRNS